MRSAVNFDHELDAYAPLKDRYNFYFTYKAVHPWWDAVALGMEEAQRQYLDKGITVTYEYMAPNAASAEDQAQRLHAAANGDYDVIGVDVADEAVVSIGYAILTPQDRRLGDVFERADNMMYERKKALKQMGAKTRDN